LTEVQVPNEDGSLLTGMYAQVSIEAATIHTPLRVPSSALITATTGTQVAVVKDGVVHLVPVTIETDLGTEVTLSSGLTGDEQVITNPSERLMEGLSVALSAPKAKQ
jgi:multidrug efflux pump subunit AcrA (membrane-fusion protein)